jgi:hypothetical protein
LPMGTVSVSVCLLSGASPAHAVVYLSSAHGSEVDCGCCGERCNEEVGSVQGPERQGQWAEEQSHTPIFKAAASLQRTEPSCHRVQRASLPLEGFPSHIRPRSVSGAFGGSRLGMVRVVKSQLLMDDSNGTASPARTGDPQIHNLVASSRCDDLLGDFKTQMI